MSGLSPRFDGILQRVTLYSAFGYFVSKPAPPCGNEREKCEMKMRGTYLRYWLEEEETEEEGCFLHSVGRRWPARLLLTQPGP